MMRSEFMGVSSFIHEYFDADFLFAYVNWIVSGIFFLVLWANVLSRTHLFNIPLIGGKIREKEIVRKSVKYVWQFPLIFVKPDGH